MEQKQTSELYYSVFITDFKNISPGKGPWNLNNGTLAYKTNDLEEKTGVFVQ